MPRLLPHQQIKLGTQRLIKNYFDKCKAMTEPREEKKMCAECQFEDGEHSFECSKYIRKDWGVALPKKEENGGSTKP